MIDPDLKALLELVKEALEGTKILSQGPSYETADAVMAKVFNAIAAIKSFKEKS